MFKLNWLKTTGFKRLEVPEKITFPDGRILIHGVNESGKSTLLEAIHYALFGMGLRPNRRASNEDLINYNRSEALIELVFSIDEKGYHVRRVLKKTSGNEHQLNAVLQDGSLEEITSGATSVNDHLQDILHGIDSDALLNSCLVEQKELGKLEASSRQERIKAMSSLLNLEAFLDARNEIKKDSNELERVHNDTKIKLQKAEQAASKYDEAEKKLEKSESRLAEIKIEQEHIQKEVKKLEELLSVLEEIKKLHSKSEESRARIEGLQETKKQIEAQLEEVERLEDSLGEIQKQIPLERKKLEEAKKEIESIQELLDLENQRKEIRTRIEKTSLMVDEANRQLEEARIASKRIKELGSEIQLYRLAEKAREKFQEIERNGQKYTKIQDEIKQLEEENKIIQDRLNSLEDSEEKISNLEKENERLQDERRKLQTRKNAGLLMIGFGGMAIIIAIIQRILIIPVIGVLLLAGGSYLFTRSSVETIEGKIHDLIEQRENLLGDISRIREYKRQLDEIQKEIEKSNRKRIELRESLEDYLEDLPEKPRDYTSLVNIENLEISLNDCREKIQLDLQTLSKLDAQKNTLNETAEKLEERERRLEEQEAKLKNQIEEQNEIHEKLLEQEQETGISLDDEKAIREKHEEIQKNLTTLITRRESALETVERKPVYEENLERTLNQLQEHEKIVQENGNKITQLEKKNSITIEDEPRTREQYEADLKTTSRLETEESERESDIIESRELMNSTRELKELFPTLQEDNTREEFRLESMRRAMVLLDTTRDSIMSGVKQNVEKHMMHFLPVLTDHHYNMARIDDTDYRIEIYDREAKQWKAKGVFSGATQDQFSLALRLAFAISTIPSSRGARPGFIFLDEPLSGFDNRRREGFMKLLQEELSQYFVQIIVISHLESLREEFEYRLEMDSGRIVS